MTTNRGSPSQRRPEPLPGPGPLLHAGLELLIREAACKAGLRAAEAAGDEWQASRMLVAKLQAGRRLRTLRRQVAAWRWEE